MAAHATPAALAAAFAALQEAQRETRREAAVAAEARAAEVQRLAADAALGEAQRDTLARAVWAFASSDDANQLRAQLKAVRLDALVLVRARERSGPRSWEVRLDAHGGLEVASLSGFYLGNHRTTVDSAAALGEAVPPHVLAALARAVATGAWLDDAVVRLEAEARRAREALKAE